MKYAKRLLAALLCLLLALSMIACQTAEETPDTTDTPDVTDTPDDSETPDGSEEPAAEVTDGTYRATATGFSWLGSIVCDVTFEGGALTDIAVVEEHETETGEMFHMVTEKYIPRLIENQSLATDAVAGATVSCSAIRMIVTDAIEQAGGDPSDWSTPIEKSTETVTKEGYDVIVVGMGGSGIASFCAAADAGAKVIGVEKAGKLGGNSATTTGPMALNSEFVKEFYADQTNGEDYIDEDAVFETWMEYVESDEKEDVIRRAVYESGEALDYYIENFGFSFEGGLLGSFVVPEWSQLWVTYTPDETGRNKLGPNKTYQFDRAVDLAIEKSPESEFMLETTATEMITDDTGAVVGVKCQNVDGTTYEIYGKTVILATGGFIANADMMMENFGATTQILGWTLCDGSGIQLGQSVGGATYNLDVLPMIHITQMPNIIRNDDLTPDQKAILAALCLVSDETAVTVDGEPWDATTEMAEIPGFRYYVVYTQEQIDSFVENGLTENFATATSHFMGQGGELTVGEPIPDLYDILAVGEQYGDVISAGSIAELAEAIGCDEATLSETLGGVDTTYYAAVTAGYAYATVGGLDIDANMNVLREDGTPIANLYAVGQDSQGVCNASGKPYSPWGGQAQSWTFVSGRIAGQAAAGYAAAN